MLSAREQEVSIPGRYYPTPPHPIVPPRMVNTNAYFATMNFNRRVPTTWFSPNIVRIDFLSPIFKDFVMGGTPKSSVVRL